MDLNDLYFRHQVSLFRADNASCDDARRGHRELADLYAAQIALKKLPASLMGHAG